MAKQLITNTLDPKAGFGARGVETPEGTVYIEPGETVEVNVLDGHELYEGLQVAKPAKADKVEK